MRKLVLGSIVGVLGVLLLAGNAHATPAVPEIDAAGATTALGLLAGLVTLLAERFRHK